MSESTKTSGTFGQTTLTRSLTLNHSLTLSRRSSSSRRTRQQRMFELQTIHRYISLSLNSPTRSLARSLCEFVALRVFAVSSSSNMCTNHTCYKKKTLTRTHAEIYAAYVFGICIEQPSSTSTSYSCYGREITKMRMRYSLADDEVQIEVGVSVDVVATKAAQSANSNFCRFWHFLCFVLISILLFVC